MNNKSSVSAESFKDLFGRLEAAKEKGEARDYWKANELQQLLSFEEQHTFFQLLKQAKSIADSEDQPVTEHFIDTEGDTDTPSNTLLTRYACHLIVRNFDATEQQVAFAQNYFIAKNRELELILERMHNTQRIAARQELAQSEKNLSGTLYERGIIGGKALAIVHTLGDKTFFGGRTTQQMKQKLHVPAKRPLADFLATPLIEAKREAAEMTRDTIIDYNLNDRLKMERAHSDNNGKMRTRLYHQGIRPEYTPAEPDIKKVQRELAKEEKDILKDN